MFSFEMELHMPRRVVPRRVLSPSSLDYKRWRAFWHACGNANSMRLCCRQQWVDHGSRKSTCGFLKESQIGNFES